MTIGPNPKLLRLPHFWNGGTPLAAQNLTGLTQTNVACAGNTYLPIYATANGATINTVANGESVRDGQIAILRNVGLYQIGITSVGYTSASPYSLNFPSVTIDFNTPRTYYVRPNEEIILQYTQRAGPLGSVPGWQVLNTIPNAASTVYLGGLNTGVIVAQNAAVLRFIICGAGGAGGAGGAAATAGGGGGGGGGGISLLEINPVSVQGTLTIQGGVGGTASASSAGGNGQDSYVQWTDPLGNVWVVYGRGGVGGGVGTSAIGGAGGAGGLGNISNGTSGGNGDYTGVAGSIGTDATIQLQNTGGGGGGQHNGATQSAGFRGGNSFSLVTLNGSTVPGGTAGAAGSHSGGAGNGPSLSPTYNQPSVSGTGGGGSGGLNATGLGAPKGGLGGAGAGGGGGGATSASGANNRGNTGGSGWVFYEAIG